MGHGRATTSFEALLSAEVEARLGDDIRAAEKVLYFQLIDEVEPLPPARASCSPR